MNFIYSVNLIFKEFVRLLTVFSCEIIGKLKSLEYTEIYATKLGKNIRKCLEFKVEYKDFLKTFRVKNLLRGVPNRESKNLLFFVYCYHQNKLNSQNSLKLGYKLICQTQNKTNKSLVSSIPSRLT